MNKDKLCEMPDAFVPMGVYEIEGDFWMEFKMKEGTYDEYKKFPEVLAYKGRIYAKMSWNSDVFKTVYKEQEVARIVDPIGDMEFLMKLAKRMRAAWKREAGKTCSDDAAGFARGQADAFDQQATIMGLLFSTYDREKK